MHCIWCVYILLCVGSEQDRVSADSLGTIIDYWAVLGVEAVLEPVGLRANASVPFAGHTWEDACSLSSGEWECIDRHFYGSLIDNEPWKHLVSVWPLLTSLAKWRLSGLQANVCAMETGNPSSLLSVPLGVVGCRASLVLAGWLTLIHVLHISCPPVCVCVWGGTVGVSLYSDVLSTV